MFTSPYPDVDIPPLSVYDYLFGSLTDEQEGRVALIDPATGAETTYGALRAQVDAFAGALATRGVGPGAGETRQTVLCCVRTCPPSPPCSTASFELVPA